MCSSSQRDPDLPLWLRSALRWIWPHREQVAVGAGVLLAVAAFHLFFAPTDRDLAVSDLERACAEVRRLEVEADQSMREANANSAAAAECRRRGEGVPNRSDRVLIEWYGSYAESNTELARERGERRRTLLALATEYRALLTEAERQILRAQTARDRGQPVRVAPHVRDVLAPILAPR